MIVHLDFGGVGGYAGAINVNPSAVTSTTGAPGRPIPNLVAGRGEQLPFASAIADMVTVESAPIRAGAAEEIARVLKPGGTVRLLHPVEYALGAGIHDAVAGALGPNATVLSRELLGDGSALTVLRRGVDLLR